MRRIFIYILTIFIASTIDIYAILPPEIRCISVNITGDVTLKWIIPSDTSGCFKSYHIFYSTSLSGPFTFLDSITNVNTTTYTHTGANANSQSLYYYIETHFGCVVLQISNPSDTLQTILLDVTTGTGTADLTWNKIHEPLLPSSSAWYRIYREYPPGNWSLIDSTQNLQYYDTITICSAFINYRIEISDSLPCSSVSSIDGDLLQDVIYPVTPVLDTVSVTSISGDVTLGWQPSSSGDTKGYIIYQYISGIWLPIDTVWGINNTSYTDTPDSLSPNSSSQSYCIAAFDSCLNTSPMGLEHNTIFLKATMAVCDNEITLNWSSYINLNPLLAGYRIYTQENGGPVILLGINSTDNRTFIHTGLNQDSEYCYFIQAFDESGLKTSSSNTVCLTACKPNQPKFIYLRYATVVDNSYVKLTCFVDTSAYVSKYNVLRSESLYGTYNTIGNIQITSSVNLSFCDYTAMFNEKSYYYKITVIDSCGEQVLTSNIAKTIYLSAQANNDFTNSLAWNDYEGWLGPVDSYNIYRKVDDISDPNPIVTLAFGINSYIDDVSNFTYSQGKFTYFVKALENSAYLYQFEDTSKSNEVTVIQRPKFFVPNAFAPAGKNNIFKPITVFTDITDYLFIIYNRWGQKIFETKNLNQGWDGQYKGNVIPGVYVYYIKLKGADNNYFKKRGTVTLVR